MRFHWFGIAIVAAVAMAAGMYFGRPSSPPQALVRAGPSPLMQLALTSPTGTEVNLKQWQGKVLVVNFWATWCPPCREEMPEFSRTQQKLSDKNVQIVGIGIDTPDSILAFQKATPVSYPLLVGSYKTLQLTGDLGNPQMALPFTAILDRKGQLAYTKLGKLDTKELESMVTSLYSSEKQ